MACCAVGPCDNPACYLCYKLPKLFPQKEDRRRLHHEASGKFAVPDAGKRAAVPTVGRKYPSKRKAKS